MNILIAPDKFKGSLSAHAVCTAIGEGIRVKWPEAKVRFHPLADGGDGTLEILGEHLDLRKVPCPTTDPLDRPMNGHYLLGKEAAFIEMATASGLVLLKDDERDPARTTTKGTGILLAHALRQPVEQVYLLIGGSATHDVGVGCAHALGFRFKDGRDRELPPIGANLGAIREIVPPVERPWPGKSIILLCDVENTLCGDNGAARVYATQKGADPTAVETLEAGTRSFGRLLETYASTPVLDLPGGGAAGGIAAGLVALLGANLQPGFKTIANLTGLEKDLDWADYVISGEGQLDGQSLQGKVVGGILNRCSDRQLPCALLVGNNALPAGHPIHPTLRSIESISSVAVNLDDAMRNAAAYLKKLAQRLDQN
ncbi:glycerate kinase [Lewinella aquimaris]|uniref:Glycerate kinase n=1 Tax=Neolewinella aquimaris TaxID=1835722 RepID=A0A840E3K1_9BACT|nr:glycerate kinase [Neolewinella aquimaris]MBB4079781.1 glycerate kinase [Neolewinella aquimaris]